MADMFRQVIARRSQGLRNLACVAVLSVTAGLPALALGAGGDLLWEDRFDAGSVAQARDVAADGGRVFAVGTVGVVSSDYLVRAYDAGTGGLLWQDRLDAGGEEVANAVVTAPGQVFVAGGADWDLLVRAYDAPTGVLLWQDRFHGGSVGGYTVISTNAGRVFAAAKTSWGELLVRAFEARTGVFLWQNRFFPGDAWHRRELDFVLGILAADGRVFVVANEYGGGSFVYAYDARNGLLLWQESRALECLSAAAAELGRVFVAGATRGAQCGEAWVVRAYDTGTGSLLWQDTFDGGASTWASGLAVGGGRVFAVGDTWPGTERHHAVVRAYDSQTGNLLWQKQIGAGGGFSNAVALEEEYVFVAENRRVSKFFVRAHIARTGRIVWKSLFNEPDTYDQVSRLAVAEGRVFAVGSTGDYFLVRALAAH